MQKNTSPTNEQRAAAMRVMSALKLPSDMAEPLAGARFQQRGLSEGTITALIAAGIDYPERLLFMDRAAVAALPGIGKAKLAEIQSYVVRFTEPGA